jgi:hypothetical protein
MDPNTLRALKGSIAKWEAIVDGTGVDNGPDNCPLCQLFRNASGNRVRCDGCPVAMHTGETGCHGTPYDAYEEEENLGDLSDGEMKNLAAAELSFLKSLLPKDAT